MYATNIHTGDKFSAMTIEPGDITTREIYGWGGKNKIDMTSMHASFGGAQSI